MEQITPDGAQRGWALLALQIILVSPGSYVLQLLQAWTKKTISKNDWEKKLAGVKVVKEDMNRLVMNFLVTEVSVKQQLCWEPTASSWVKTVKDSRGALPVTGLRRSC